MKKILINALQLVLALFVSVFSAHAQVTIGSDALPIKGALLDLKEFVRSDTSTAQSGGLVLPRVKLQDRSTLEPFIQPADPAWKPGKSQDQTRAEHIGLMVYNLEDGKGFQEGIYLWTSGGWRQLETASNYIYAPSFNLKWHEGSVNLYEIYKNNLKPTNLSHYVSSKGVNVPVDFPDFESSPESFHYVVSDYSDEVLVIKNIDSSGVLNYAPKDPSMKIPPAGSYLNVIMIRK